MRNFVRAYAIGIFVVGCGSQAGGESVGPGPTGGAPTGGGGDGTGVVPRDRANPNAPGNQPGPSNPAVPSETAGGEPPTPVRPSRPIEPPEPPAERTKLALGLAISKIDLSQGVNIRLVTDGKRVKTTTPIVAKRPGLLRVFTAPDASWQAHEVTAELQLTNGGQPVATLVDKKTIKAMSTEADLKSTFAFKLTTEQMLPGLEYTVSILDEEGDDTSSTESSARYPKKAQYDAIAVARIENNLRVRIVPVVYDGRTPDVSPAAIERYRKMMFAMYPASAVTLDVRANWPYAGDLGSQGMGFGELVQSLIELRANEVESQEIYYYGVVNPAATIVDYCSQGCVAGLTISSTENSEDPIMRVSAGLGFPGQETTMAHEIGHAHGRLHAPCTQVGQMASIDTDFPATKPYENGNDDTELGGGIGVWGYNIVSKSLFDPVRSKDVMGYCQHNWSVWISDYTYSALYKRMIKIGGRPIAGPSSTRPATPPVTAPSALLAANSPRPTTYRFIGVDGAGKLSWGRTVTRTAPTSLPSHRVTFKTADGATDSEVQGHYYPYSDMPGGVVLVPEPEARVQTIAVEGLSGAQVREVSRP